MSTPSRARASARAAAETVAEPARKRELPPRDARSNAAIQSAAACDADSDRMPGLESGSDVDDTSEYCLSSDSSFSDEEEPYAYVRDSRVI